MSTFIWFPSYSSTSGEVTFKTRDAKFGDGYEQSVQDGINSLKREWNLQFDLPREQTDAIEVFLKAHKGTMAFDWTPPSGEAGRWKCKGYKPTPSGFNSITISAVFQETFGD